MPAADAAVGETAQHEAITLTLAPIRADRPKLTKNGCDGCPSCSACDASAVDGGDREHSKLVQQVTCKTPNFALAAAAVATAVAMDGSLTVPFLQEPSQELADAARRLSFLTAVGFLYSDTLHQ